MNTPKSIELEEPLKREGGDITHISVRKPNSGELRGLSLVELLNLQVDPLHKLLPRITIPAINEPEAKKLSPADLVQLGTEVALFLAPKAVREEYPAE